MRVLFLIALFVFSPLFYPTKAFAYLDPGTGSILLQAILAGVAGAGVVFKLFWGRIMGFFHSKGSKDASNEELSSEDENQTPKRAASK